MKPLDTACEQALKLHCHAIGLPAPGPELTELARIICAAAGAQSLSSWLSPPDKRALLEALVRALGPLDSNQLALAEQFFAEGMDPKEIVARLSKAHLDAVVQRANLAKAAVQEEERRRRDYDSPGP